MSLARTPPAWQSRCLSMQRQWDHHWEVAGRLQPVGMPQLSDAEAHRLGWVKAPNLCRGHFQGSPRHRRQSSDHLVVDTKAPVWVHQSGLSYWQGPLRAHWRGHQVEAQRWCAWVTPKRQHFQRGLTDGSVRYEHGGMRAYVHQLSMRGERAQVAGIGLVWRWLSHHGASWWGYAQRMQEHQAHLVLENSTLSACTPQHPSWWIHARRLILDKTQGWGDVWHMVMHVGRWPVFYWPYWHFPIDGKRHSGLLMPRVSQSHASGFELGLPFYWNIAPQADMQVTPLWSARRQGGLDVSWRYLHPLGLDQWQLWQQWHDPAFVHWRDALASHLHAHAARRLSHFQAHRWAWIWQHQWHWGPHWHSQLQWQQVSDPYWLRDFPERSGQLHGPYLPHAWELTWEHPYGYMHGLWLGFQVLHPVDESTVTPIYEQRPRWQWLFHDHMTGPWHVQLFSEWLHFRRTEGGEQGHRWLLQPSIQMAHDASLGHVQAQLRWYEIRYGGRHPRVGVPEVSLDWRAYGEKPLRWRQQRWSAQWQPHLYYAWIPYRAAMQSLPRIDDSLPRWSFDRLFTANRFVGGDRVGDTHRLVGGMRHRWKQVGGAHDTLTAELGQGYLLQQPKLGLNEPWQIQSHHHPHWLPLVIGGGWSRPGWLSWQAALAYDWQQGTWNQTHLSVNVPKRPALARQVYGQVDYVIDHHAEPEPLRQIQLNVHANWDAHWQWRGSARYNITRSQMDHLSVGLLYQSCCWSLGVVHTSDVLARDTEGQRHRRHAVYLQWSLYGLGRLGHLPI